MTEALNIEENEKNFPEKIALALSYIFDGTFISIPLYVVICLTVVENISTAVIWALLCILFNILIPYLYILFLYKKKAINDLHIPHKRNRMKPLFVSLVSYFIGYISLHILKSPLFLRSIFAVGIVLNIIYIVVTYYWKISLHTSWIAFVVVTLNVLFGLWMLLLVPLIPIVGWARIRIRRHTLTQVVLGAGVATAVALLVYSYYGFISFFN